MSNNPFISGTDLEIETEAGGQSKPHENPDGKPHEKRYAKPDEADADPVPPSPPLSLPGVTRSKPSAAPPPFDPDAPLSEAWSSPLLDDDISGRIGNYIVSFGFPGSGKTTLHSFLLRYLMQVGPYKTEPINVKGASGVDFETSRILTEWMGQWQQGRFPKANPVGEDQIREMTFAVQPIRGVRTPLDFSILELSGEMMQSVIPKDGRNPNISQVLRNFFNNKKIRVVLLLLVHPKHHHNDQLFANLMHYLDTNLDFNIREHASLGIVISDPAAALKYLQAHRTGYEALAELRGEHCVEFLKAFAPTTFRIYHEWPKPKNRMITRLYIGNVEERDGENRLVRQDYTSIAKIFEWTYLQFVGRKPGPTRWQRFWLWIRA